MTAITESTCGLCVFAKTEFDSSVAFDFELSGLKF